VPTSSQSLKKGINTIGCRNPYSKKSYPKPMKEVNLGISTARKETLIRQKTEKHQPQRGDSLKFKNSWSTVTSPPAKSIAEKQDKPSFQMVVNSSSEEDKPFIREVGKVREKAGFK
jgi:hypothetical protein